MKFDRRCQRIYQIGCLACRSKGWFSACQVHHLNLDGKAGQKRRGDASTIGLCPWHHVGEPPGKLSEYQARRKLGASLRLHSRFFRVEFGSDDELLAQQNRLIADAEARVVGHRSEAKEVC